ncbi:hypothetical protein HPB50_007492 [Hyalomma asiaticum]|uniref:Uncharacterized protein n=1 Tax=Hyalomma asiaticum TaxID=266040 RepID=A0ACB7S5B8_HYAAI|nr:hypothetical protein HPB50_007492 [Hyalomma asiaticum]
MASSTKSFLGDRAVKDAQGSGASGGPAVSHRLDAPDAAHGRLLSELKKLLVVAPKTPSPDGTIGLRDSSHPSRPRSYYDGHRTSTRLRPPGESAKRFPSLTKPVTSSSCRQRADVQVLVTSRGPSSVHGATAEGRQADGVRQSGLVCRVVNRFNEKASLQDNQVRAAVNVSKKAPPGILCDTPSAGDAESREFSEGKTEQKEDRSQNCSGDTSCQGEEDSSFHLPPLEERWQSMRNVVVHVNERVDGMARYIQDNQVRAVVNVSKKAPSGSLCDTPPAGDAQSRDVSETKREQKEDLSHQNCSGDTRCEGEEESSFHHLSSEESRQRVREALARVTETLDEMIHDVYNIFPTEESFGTGQSPASPMPKPSDDISALLSFISQLNQDAEDAANNEQVLEEDYDDSLYPRISSRRCIVIDEIDAYQRAHPVAVGYPLRESTSKS